MAISDLIRKRFWDQDLPYKVSDNIAEQLKPGELKELEDEVAAKFKQVMFSLVIDLTDDNSAETPRRLAKMFLYEIFAGRYYPRPKVTDFDNSQGLVYNGMLVVKAEIKSVCAHHWQPVTGMAYIGVIPNGRVLGLSKYVRLAQWCARRGTTQELLTDQIAKEITKATGSRDVGIHIRAEHGCMTNRGVMAHSSLTQTTMLYGEFEKPHVKEEFFNNIQMQQHA